MKILFQLLVAVTVIVLTSVMAPAYAVFNLMVGGASMLATKDIVDNVVNFKDHITLVAVVKVAGLVEMLKGPGLFTVFVLINVAFSALPVGTVDILFKFEFKAMLTKVLTYYVVSGKVDVASLIAKIKVGGGSVTLTTV